MFDDQGFICDYFKQNFKYVHIFGIRISANLYFINAIKHSIAENKDLSQSPDQTLKYLLKYKDVSFIKKALKLWLDKNRYEIVMEAIKTDNAQLFKQLIELGDFDIHKKHYYTDRYSNMFECAVALNKDNIVTYFVQHAQQKDLSLLLKGALGDYDWGNSFQGSHLIKAIKILLDAYVDIDFVYDDGKKAVDYLDDYDDCHYYPIKKISEHAAQKKALQDIDRVWTHSEKEIHEKLQKNFDLLGLDYRKFFNLLLAGRDLDQFVFGYHSGNVLSDIFCQSKIFCNSVFIRRLLDCKNAKLQRDVEYIENSLRIKKEFSKCGRIELSEFSVAQKIIGLGAFGSSIMYVYLCGLAFYNYARR